LRVSGQSTIPNVPGGAIVAVFRALAAVLPLSELRHHARSGRV
jgi:hypothetical protein